MNPKKIVARNRAMGLVPPEVDGAIVSNHIPVFITYNEMLHQNFMNSRNADAHWIRDFLSVAKVY